MAVAAWWMEMLLLLVVVCCDVVLCGKKGGVCDKRKSWGRGKLTNLSCRSLEAYKVTSILKDWADLGRI